MADSGSITVRPQSLLKIERFVHAGTSNEGSLISLLRGACRIIPGKTEGQYSQNDLVKTPNAVVVVNRADHETTVILPEDNGRYPSGTYDKVNSGITLVKTGNGEIGIHANQVGFAAGITELPALLKEPPGFYNNYPAMKQDENASERQK